MVQIDVPIAFGIGSFFADAASSQLRFGGREHYYRAMLKNNIFQIFFFSWIPLYFVLNYFGWETTHMWWHADSVTAYPYFVPILVVVFFGVANLGFLLGKSLVAKNRLWTNRLVYLGVAIYALIWVFSQTSSTFRLGSYTQWKQGTSPYFYQDHTFLGMFIFSMVVWFVGLALFALNLWREGRSLERFSDSGVARIHV
jgi:uncharacterized membrane protein